MIQRIISVFFKFILQTAIVAGLYILTARLGFLIALPPGNVTPLWPPSGIALAAGLVLGFQVGVGVWLGSFIVNMGSLAGAAAPATAALIASGSTLQMFLGVLLLRRFVPRTSRIDKTQRPVAAPTTPLGILFFIGLTALAALAAPTIGVTSMCVAGFAPWTNFYTLWWTWWFGDYAGMLTVAPIVIVVALWLHKQATAEPIFFPLASIWLGLSLIAFSVLWHTEEQSLAARLRQDADQITRDIRQVVYQNLDHLVGVESLYATSNNISRNDFHLFVSALLQDDSPALQALAWVPHVLDTERDMYQRAAQQDGFLDFAISKRDAAGNLIVAGQRPEYFPVYFIEPYAGNEVALGFDLASGKAQLQAIATARDTGRVTVTAPIKLVQETGQQRGILMLAPVYRLKGAVNSVATRQSNFLGVLSAVVRVGDMVQSALYNLEPNNAELYLFDTTAGDVQFLTFYSCTGQISPPAQDLKPASLLTGFYTISELDVSGRKWLTVVRACPAYVASGHGPTSWAVLLMGLALSGIVLAYTEIRQRAEIALRESEALTRLVIDNAPDAILAVDDMGQIVLTNAQAEVIFGYSHDELLDMSIEDLLPERFREQHLRHRLRYKANPVTRKMGYGLSLYGRRKDYTEFPVDVKISPLETSLGRLTLATISDISERKRVEMIMVESEQTYRALFEHANDAIFLIGLDGTHQQVNQKAADLLGYTREELIGMNVRDVVAPGEFADSQSKLDALLQGHILPSYERLFRKKNGQIFPAEINLSTVRDAEGKHKYLQSIVRDITERKNALEQIHQLNATLEHRVVERTTELQREISERKKVELALQLSHDQLQQSVAELERRNREVTLLGELTEILESCNNSHEAYQAVSHHLPRLFPEDAGVLYMISNSRGQVDAVAQWGKLPVGMAESTFNPMDCWALRRGREHSMEVLTDIICKHVARTVPLPLPCLCVPMIAHGETLGILHIRYTLRDGQALDPVQKQMAMAVAEQLALVLANLNLRETLRNQSIRDALTGLYNRRYMEEAFERELRRAERAGRPLSVAMLDLDHFKRFNDTFGHAAGDLALRTVADQFKSKMRAGDVVCRYGGEEFVIIFVEMTLQNAIHRMEGFRESIKKLVIEYQGHSLGQLTVSVGIASFPEYGTSPEVLLKAADDALYRAKQNGRDRVIVIEL